MYPNCVCLNLCRGQLNDHAVNLFFDLAELQDLTVEWISYSLIDFLQSYEIMEDYSKTYLVCIFCDGTTVMLENKHMMGTIQCLDSFSCLA
jgi:hypothetical protein